MLDDKRQFDFDEISRGAFNSFRALRVLVTHIGGFADDYDKTILSAFTSEITALFPTLGSRLEKTRATVESAVSEQSDQGPDGQSSFLPPPTEDETEAIKQEAKDLLGDENRLTKLLNAAAELARRTPMQGHLIRRGALTTLLSQFDDTLAQLIHAFYERYPSALSGEDRTLTLADLRQIASVSEAEKLIIEKEIDSVLRESTEKQIAYFHKRLKLELGPIKELLPCVIETGQRRNIYVHNHGRVNHQYLATTDHLLISQYCAEHGKVLPLSTDYLTTAIDTVSAASAILINICWRKWGDSKDADSNLVLQTFEGLNDQRYAFVKSLAGFVSGADDVEDATRMIVVINQAIALRESGSQEGIKALLAGLDWSAASLKFALALHVLRDQQDEFLKLLPKALAAEEIGVKHLKTWPLFSRWRGLAWFDAAVTEAESPK